MVTVMLWPPKQPLLPECGRVTLPRGLAFCCHGQKRAVVLPLAQKVTTSVSDIFVVLRVQASGLSIGRHPRVCGDALQTKRRWPRS